MLFAPHFEWRPSSFASSKLRRSPSCLAQKSHRSLRFWSTDDRLPSTDCGHEAPERKDGKDRKNRENRKDRILVSPVFLVTPVTLASARNVVRGFCATFATKSGKENGRPSRPINNSKVGGSRLTAPQAHRNFQFLQMFTLGKENGFSLPSVSILDENNYFFVNSILHLSSRLHLRN